jgi:hypothetical protein
MKKPRPAPAEPAASSRWDRVLEFLFRPTDVASLVYFRIAFGAIMLWEVYRYLSKGRVYRYYIEPDFHFHYEGFAWVQPWPGDGMYLHFYAMGLLAVFIMAGFLYRISAALFFLAFTHIFLIDQALYLNHFYFVCLVSFTMIFVPANQALSVDRWMRGRPSVQTVPAWPLWVIRAQMGFVYFFAGVAKLNGDWLRGYPMMDWMRGRADLPVIGPALAEPVVGVLMAWAGAALDLFIVPALLWRRTRIPALIAAVTFHLMNAWIFSIGIFPWFSIAATLMFLDPSWPRRLLGHAPLALDALRARMTLGPRERTVGALVVAWIGIQAVIPLRPVLYSGVTSWTEEGHRFSWHQKLRGKDGYVRFLLTDPSTGNSWTVDPRPLLTRRQYSKMTDRPHLIHQFARHLSTLATEEGKPPVEVRASSMVSLNGREMQPMIDSTVNLAAQPERFVLPHTWIVPLEVPLEAQWDFKSPPKHPKTLALIERHRQRFLEQADVDVAAEGPRDEERDD